MLKIIVKILAVTFELQYGYFPLSTAGNFIKYFGTLECKRFPSASDLTLGSNRFCSFPRVALLCFTR